MSHSRRSGQSLAEYALALALVAVVAISALLGLGAASGAIFSTVASEVGSLDGSGPGGPPTPTPSPTLDPAATFHDDNDFSLFAYTGDTGTYNYPNSDANGCMLLWNNGNRGQVTFTVAGTSFSVINASPEGNGGFVTVSVNGSIVNPAQYGTAIYFSNPGDQVLIQGNQGYNVACFDGSTFRAPPPPTLDPAAIFHDDNDTSVFAYAGNTQLWSYPNADANGCTLLWNNGNRGQVTFTVGGSAFSVINASPDGQGGTITVSINGIVVRSAQYGTVIYASHPGDVVLLQGNQGGNVACFDGSTF